MSGRLLFWGTTLAALAAIGVLGFRLHGRTGGVAGVIPISRESVRFEESVDLVHFYEPAPHVETPLGPNPPWLDVQPRYTINADTLNDRFDYAIPKPAGTYRILVLGDSVTFGIFVSTPENYSEVLENLLNQRCGGASKFEVLNLGVFGYDVRYTVERFKRRGVKYEPDLIVWFLQDGNFLKIQELIAERESRYEGDPGERADQARRDILGELGEEEVFAYQESALRSMADAYAGVLLVYSPDRRLSGQAEQALERFTSAHQNVRLYPSNLALKAAGGLFPDGGHPNAQGQALMADDLFGYLTQNRLIPCSES